LSVFGVLITVKHCHQQYSRETQQTTDKNQPKIIMNKSNQTGQRIQQDSQQTTKTHRSMLKQSKQRITKETTQILSTQ